MGTVPEVRIVVMAANFEEDRVLVLLQQACIRLCIVQKPLIVDHLGIMRPVLRARIYMVSYNELRRAIALT